MSLGTLPRYLLLLLFFLNPIQVFGGYLADIQKVLVSSGIQWAEGMPAIIEGMALRSGDVFANSSKELLVRLHTVPVKEGIARELAYSKTLQQAVLERVTFLTENYSGEQLRIALTRSYNWKALGSRRLGSAAINSEMLLFMAGAAVIGVYTQMKIDEIYNEYTGELNAFKNAVDQESYNHLVKLLVDRIASGQLRFCQGVDMREGLRLLRINMQVGVKPYAMIVHECSRSQKPSGELEGDWINTDLQFAIRFLEHGKGKYIGTLLRPTRAQQRAGYHVGEEVVYVKRLQPKVFVGSAKIRTNEGEEEWDPVQYKIDYDLNWSFDEMTDNNGDYWHRYINK